MKKMLVIATVLMALHTLEEAVWYLWAAKPAGLPSLSVYAVVQVALYGFIGIVFWKPSKVLYGVVGVILLYELVHLLSALRASAYTPGLVTAIAILVFAIPYWIKLCRTDLKFL